jgi:hypothetical protein
MYSCCDIQYKLVFEILVSNTYSLFVGETEPNDVKLIIMTNYGRESHVEERMARWDSLPLADTVVIHFICVLEEITSVTSFINGLP